MTVSDNPPEPFPGHDHGVWAPVTGKVVASWPAGHFAENLVVDGSGVVLVSLHSHERIDAYHPATGTVTRFAQTPAPVAGLVFDGNGTLWATGGRLGEPPGYVWRITGDGTCREWAQIPDALFMNGCAMHPDGRTLLACESVTGRVLAIALGTGAWRTWGSDDLLRPFGQQIPGANGIKLRGGCAWVSVTARNCSSRFRSSAAEAPASRASRPNICGQTTSRSPPTARRMWPPIPPTRCCAWRPMAAG